MIVRFGFVAMSVMLKNASPSRTMTYLTFSKLADREAAVRRLERITEENLHNALRVLRHAHAHDIRVYRFSSKIIPLFTHDALIGWNPFAAEEVLDKFRETGRFVREHGIRVSFHPDHFCVLNTPKPEVLAKSVEDLDYHVRMFEAMGLGETAKCNIHVGGAYGDKEASAARFVRQFGGLDNRFRRRITLENDDKTYTARETLAIAEAADVPMVLDIHHHAVNDGGMTEAGLLGEVWPGVLRTWDKEQRRLAEAAGAPGGGAEERGAPASARALSGAAVPAAAAGASLPPKIHASSPKPGRDPRAHADHVEAEPLLRFLQAVAGSCPRLDVMLEAKRKDEALLHLMDDMRAAERSGRGVRVADGATVEIGG